LLILYCFKSSLMWLFLTFEFRFDVTIFVIFTRQLLGYLKNS
jgi:hypothetical protein